MRLILFDLDDGERRGFYPLSLSRPVWELRCGVTTLGAKLIAAAGADDVACFVPPYLAETYRASCPFTVNDPATLRGDELLVVDGRVKAEALPLSPAGPSEVAVDRDGRCIYARIAPADADRHKCADAAELLAWARDNLPQVKCDLPLWCYTWDLMLANPDQITADFASAGHSGIEGTFSYEARFIGSQKDIFVAPGATVGSMVVIDASGGPVYIDQGAEIQPFSHIAGPCYIGRDTTIYGAQIRSGNSIGPMCRIGGELADSVIDGYTNKYHGGYLGHAYVGRWVNLGAMTANSDLKSDYSSVALSLDGRNRIDTGSIKVGSLIGDHAKTSIGTLLNTGAYVGAMSMIVAAGRLVPKFFPSFAFLDRGNVTDGFARERLYTTAAVAMARRDCVWTPAAAKMWDAVYDLTANPRAAAIERSGSLITK